MRFVPTELTGVVLIEPEPIEDARGFFARTYCAAEFVAAGLSAGAASQCSIAFNRRRGTLRGLHVRDADHPETKVVRCIRGAIHDVALDLRRDSPSFGRWHAERLTADNRRALFIPAGVAHGYLTLTDDAEVLYQMDSPHVEGVSLGIRWDDPAFGVAWPERPTAINERDAGYPDYVLDVSS